ncbi:hypothetical protein [Candidatus Poriferisocius sp.]|uniref:hypothetical protein n=1 Tax=Candidatus Poriferisocius sp. TaxID=3101276 RepID=UPI003B5A6D37
MAKTTTAAPENRDETLAEFFERVKSTAPGTSTATTEEVVDAVRKDRDASNL